VHAKREEDPTQKLTELTEEEIEAEVQRLSKLSYKERQYELYKKKHNIVITPMTPEELKEYEEDLWEKFKKSRKPWQKKKSDEEMKEEFEAWKKKHLVGKAVPTSA